MSTLFISSDKAFHSIQGEGKHAGVSAVFLRLAKCHVKCAWCDTTKVWSSATEMSFEEVYGLLAQYSAAFRRGTHLVVTGGSPLLQQGKLAAFLDYFYQNLGVTVYTELETEGTLMPYDPLSAHIDCWNVSPKLANSGVPQHVRLNWDVLSHYSRMQNRVCFKFPVSGEQDIDEVLNIVRTARLLSSQVYLMPVCNTREEHIRIAPSIVDLALKFGFNFSPRLQLLIWDQATGV